MPNLPVVTHPHFCLLHYSSPGAPLSRLLKPQTRKPPPPTAIRPHTASHPRT
eukprot:XP_001699814.1 predicted protein [Chlamydomonas reinhardtii]